MAGVDHWRHDDALRAFALASPLGPIAAALLRSERIRLWEDSVLVKDPGTPFETSFHTDASYFHVTGDQLCTMWVPLDAATPDSGMVRWVRGSHLDRVEYRPNLFVTDEPIAGTRPGGRRRSARRPLVPVRLAALNGVDPVGTFDPEPCSGEMPGSGDRRRRRPR